MGSRFIKKKKKVASWLELALTEVSKEIKNYKKSLGVYFTHTLVNAINLESHQNAFSKASLAKFYFIKAPTVRVKHKLHSWSIQGRENCREQQRQVFAPAQDKRPCFPA